MKRFLWKAKSRINSLEKNPKVKGNAIKLKEPNRINRYIDHNE